MSGSKSIAFAILEEGARMANICNACRYCEGYCAVFPALERRVSFGEADLAYLANLCHNCGACFYSCQYAPPHEFGVNLPKVLAEIRGESYRKYAWPAIVSGAFERNGTFVSIAAAICLVITLLLISATTGAGQLLSRHPDSQGSFYSVVSHNAMTVWFSAVGIFDVLALTAGFLRFWKDTGEPLGHFFRRVAFSRALWDAGRLRYLDGGGDGCTYPKENFSQVRRGYHHFTSYGFLLCFASTCVAAFYDNILKWRAPYPFWSVPVLSGTAGGAGLVIGTLGLLWLKRQRNIALVDEGQTGMDTGFLLLLLLTGITGLLLLGLRQSSAMGILLALHLGLVTALLVTLPYGKFVHAVYRFAALVRFHLENERTSQS